MMNIKFSSVRMEETLQVFKLGDQLTLNGETFDFSIMVDGDTLPRGSVKSRWFDGEVDKQGGVLSLTLILPNPANYSQEQAFPVPLTDVPDGFIALPDPLPTDDPVEPALPSPEPVSKVGVIDWSQLITKKMKDAEQAARELALAKADLAARNSAAAFQIARIQDRIETLGYGIEAGDATEEEEEEAEALAPVLKAWKAYKFALGKVTAQPTWHQAPVWPVAPAIPEIAAAPMLVEEPLA
ncbi:hypothetical protein ALP76_00146 [Pseudomonas savastanoi pv. glycinea]|uniref:Tail fiber assembly domain-containing protein n=4 Tax=Pseudomonas TaxID=286 RepID=A0A3M4Z3M5_PSESG|nr:hypothetical protein [Pseudomonas savastanoi]MBN4175534.1 hypothetical protein [Pseudomonas savastanoi pv. phaseolicola]RMM71676.1 hypothetical protein ALQ73_04225 [Pseudomonas savastanoi pv. glycinea]RMR94962.1 hypothetical protein ALP76_00146 [Pseudomonas savastanoi pv. glycinea]